MASALEGSGEEDVDELESEFGGYEARGKHEHVGVVVFAGEFCNLGLPAERGAYALMLVEGHADAVAGSADGYCGVDLACLECERARMCEVGVVAAVGAVCAEVLERVCPAIRGSPLSCF